ncbi:MAG TPA: catalase family peroxidase [Bryobacteraceae bacterium]|nr:catalase family peroxidase [Bryobacteraceae bacterium]
MFVRIRKSWLTSFLLMATHATVAAWDSQDLSRQIAEVMSHSPSGQAHQRFTHAKGIVCRGAFVPSPGAVALSRAAHFRGAKVPITVRFSNGAPDIAVPDNSSDAAPRGISIRFQTEGPGTDILAISRNGFIVGTGEEFLELQKAIAATDRSKPHPWPIETFLGSHPRAVGFLQDLKSVPASFANETYFANNAFVFVNAAGEKRAGRYQIIPVDGRRHLDDGEASKKSTDFLGEELRARLAKAPAAFRLQVQLAQPGDPTNDSSIVWPADREVVTLGILTIESIVPDSAAAERKLAFDPTRLVDGIELSDDPLPVLRSRVYAISVAGRAGR